MKSFLLPALAVLLLASCQSEPKKLPFLGEREPVEKQVDGKTVIDTVYQTIPSFSYVNQDSSIFTDQQLSGKVYVADFFFTSCNTICPIMHRNMLGLYNDFKDEKQLAFVSYSIDAKYDQPSRLKTYATKLGVNDDRWQFLHGSADSIYNVSAKSYMVAAYPDKADPQGLVHQGWFILVDKQKRMRGAYDGTKEDQVKKLAEDIKILLAEDEK